MNEERYADEDGRDAQGEADEADDGEDGDETSETETAQAAPVERPRDASKMGFGKPGPGRPKKKEKRYAPTAHGVQGTVPKTKYDNAEADLLWPEIIAKLPEEGKSPYDLAIRVWRTDPPPLLPLGSFDASAVMGDATRGPGDALHNMVIEVYHLPWQADSPAFYQIQFVWKKTGHIYQRGELRLPSRSEIAAMRQAEWQQRSHARSAGNAPFQFVPPPPPGMGAAPPPYQLGVQPVPYYYGQPPPQQMLPPPQMPLPAQESEDLRRLREEVRQLRDKLPEPPPPPTVEQLVESAVERGLGRMAKALGISMEAQAQPQGQGQGLGAQGLGARTPQRMASEAQMAVSGFESMVDMVSKLKTVGEQLNRTFAGQKGAGLVQETGEQEEEEELPPDDPVSFAVADVGPDVKWKDGRPVKIAVDKETGKIDWVGVALANPPISEKLVDRAGEFLSRLGKGMERAQAVGAGARGQEPDRRAPELPETSDPNGAPDKRGWDLS